MNKVVPIAFATVGGIGIGFGVGYTVAMRRANKKISGMIDDLDSAYKDALERATKTGRYATIEAYKDSLERATKTGRYATIDGAYESVLQTPTSGIETAQAEVEQESLPMFDPTPDEASNLEGADIHEESDEERSAANLAEFAERFKNREAEPEPAITVNGEAVEPEDAEPIPTVPGFVTRRDPNGPYVISIDDFMADDGEAFQKQELTYFSGDEVLIDAREAVVGSLKSDRAGIDRTIGVQNLDRWGSGTTDPDQVYIRNERLAIDFEVTRDDRTYTRVVLEIKAEDEITRSMQKPLKMREGDDA